VREEVAMRFEGKHLVVVGGSSGIGQETARLALAEGAFVTIAGRSEGRLRRAAEDLGASVAGSSAGGRLRAVLADITDESSIRALFEGEPRVDHLFVPAGELRPGGACVLAAELDELRSILEVRLMGVAHVVRHARPTPQKEGTDAQAIRASRCRWALHVVRPDWPKTLVSSRLAIRFEVLGSIGVSRRFRSEDYCPGS
jgi:NAD(P)-dependent dehydrogenase (short-subunit alcohol dehydrogenase family)